MKRLIMTAIVGLGLLSSLSAQTKGSLELGFNFGYNTSSISSSMLASKHGEGFNVGGSIHYYFSRSWSIEGKLIYDQKGWDHDYIDGEEGVTYKTNYNLTYLTVPIMANYYFGDEEKRNWFIAFGAYTGFLLSAKDTRFGVDVSESFYKNDYGLALGCGVKIPVNNQFNVLLEIEGQSGFTNIFQHTDTAIRISRTGFNVGVNYVLK